MVPADDGGPRLIVRLVPADAPGERADARERITPFFADGAIAPSGERATLWVRNASVTGASVTNRFERYYQGKYINRSSELSIPLASLGVGEQVINPGGHRFTIGGDGRVASGDPDVTVDGRVVTLKIYGIDLFAASADAPGPLEGRMQPEAFDLSVADADSSIKRAPGNVPLLSRGGPFCPLRIYLPANTEGAGYLLGPYGQTFHVLPGGRVELTGDRLAGISVEGSRIAAEYAVFKGRISTKTQLGAGIGAGTVRGDAFVVRPSRAALRFTAGFGAQSLSFGLPIDAARLPVKYFVADNTGASPSDVRLMAIEMERNVVTVREPTSIALRYAESALSIREPAVRAAWSAYYPDPPSKRVWTSFDGVAWRRDTGALSIRMPDLSPGFYYVRLMIVDGAEPEPLPTGVCGEILVAAIRPGQTGTAAFVSPRGRDAFVAGETVRLEAVIRSADAARPSGRPSVVLTHPGGRTERMPFADRGGVWSTQPLGLAGETTRHLPPGRYALSFADLPAGIEPWPMAFDLVGSDPRTAYTIVKNDKYAGSIPLNWSGSEAVDLDRAARSIAGMGYTRIEFAHDFDAGAERTHVERERIAERDPRLPPPQAVYQPSPRDCLLNACVRHGLQLSNTLLGYNDFHIPRHIEPYVQASERWIARKTSSMRHSPAFDGMFIYQEMYAWGKMGVEASHTELWPRIRDRVAAERLGERPSDIRNRMGRELRRPRAARDPEAINRFLELRRVEIGSWGDFNSRVARAAREVLPRARIGTYNQEHLQVTHGLGAICTGIDMDCGFRPDVFRDLDIRSTIHYQDGPCGGWIHSPMQVQLLRFELRRPVWINYPVRILNYMPMPRDGQYQRRMAFAFLAEGADGVSLWGLAHSFGDAPNPAMLKAGETTAHLNREILQPFGELVTATEPGYRRIGIVHTWNQMILSDFKELRTANQIEEIWLACWRLGFPAVFLREDAFERPLDGLDVIFVPGIRFDGELSETAVQRLREAIARGARVVVDRNSILDLDGMVRLDFDFSGYFLGTGYNPGKYEDEIYRIFRYTQPAVDFLAGRLAAWTQPAARGPFSVGPNWRTGGDIHYLIMGNFEMPDYSASLKQVMARPVRLPLSVAADRGGVAYDLLHGVPLPLERVVAEDGRPDGPDDPGWNRMTVDMTRIQGALVAFTPEAVGGLQTEVALAADGGAVRVGGTLAGVSGRPINGVFPARITLAADGFEPRRFYRALGGGRAVALQLPGGADEVTWRVEVREGLTGLAVEQSVARPAVAGRALRPLAVDHAYMPYPDEVRRFWGESTNVLLVVGSRSSDLAPVADALAKALEGRGLTVTRKTEREAFRYPGSGKDGMEGDPLANGFFTWGGYGRGQQPIKPTLAVDAPLVLLTTANGSMLLHTLEDSGYFGVPLIGGAGLAAQPTVHRARRAFHPDFDTLCLVANDAEGMRQAMAAALGGAADAPPPAPAAAGFAPGHRAGDARPVPVPPPSERVGNNEMITDIRFDAAGNSYATTWGHGDNLYSLDREGAYRYSLNLPELGPYAIADGHDGVVAVGGDGAESRLLPGFALGVYKDRIVACTAVGARLYQIGLDGTPIWQLRLSMETGVGEERTPYWPVFRYAEPTGLVVYRDDMNGAMRIIDRDGKLAAQWEGDPYEDPEDTAAGMRRGFHAFAINPEGNLLAQIESTRYRSGGGLGHAYDSYLVVRDMTGKKLAEWPKSIANEMGGVTVGVRWPVGEGPVLTLAGESIRFDAGLTRIIGRTPPPASGVFAFGEHGALQRLDARTLIWVDRDGRRIAMLDPFEVTPTVAELSPDGSTFFFLDEYGQASFIDAPTGKRRCAFTVPELGSVARFTPDSARLLIGGFRGTVQAYDRDGTPLWRRSLADHNRTLRDLQPLDRVVGFPMTRPAPSAAFIDHTDQQWPSLEDAPGQIDALVSLDPDRLANGDAEGDGGWVAEEGVAYTEGGFNSARSLIVGTNLVTQEVSNYIGDHFTWILEFRYRRASDSGAARLTAGLLARSREAARDPLVVVRHFDAGAEWRFARIVAKSGAAAASLSAGFRSADGLTRVDAVSLRRIRFPSVNHMLYGPVHDVTPRILTTPRFMETYDPVGRLREEIPNRIIVENLHTISQNLLESAFLQNARLNDVGSDWYIYPMGDKADIGLGLREPRWISMVGVYFNAYDEANITPHYDILVTDLNAGQTRLVASVRNNRRLFNLTAFKPVLTDAVTVRVVNALTRQRTLTEIEVYGPLSGREGDAGFVDPDGQNACMGDFTRVDKRRLELGGDYEAQRGTPVQGVGGTDKLPIWNYPVTQPLVGEGRMHVGRALGYAQSHAVTPGAVRTGIGRVNGFGFGNPGALYGGLWLLPGNDGSLYGVDLASSRTLWSVPLGERLRSGPVAVGNDVFAASDTGRLCALDLGSGAILREATLEGGVTGSLATDGTGLVLIREDGQLQCWEAASFKLRWSVPVAPWTESTPAIDGGVVYTADRLGVVRAVQMVDGSVLWSRELEGEFTRCPVVADTSLYLGFHGGRLVALNRADGAIRWSVGIGTRFNHEPLPVILTGQEPGMINGPALLVVNNGVLTVVDTADGTVRPWTVRVHDRGKVEAKEVSVGDLPVSLSYYRGHLYWVSRVEQPALQFGGPLHRYDTGSAFRLVPAPQEHP